MGLEVDSTGWDQRSVMNTAGEFTGQTRAVTIEQHAGAPAGR